jgi:hypothetical protein
VLSYRLLQQLTSSIMAPFQEWLLAHPVWHWLFTHPVWLLGLVILSLFLFVGLLGAIAQLTEAVWLAILQFPLKLVQWIFTAVVALFKLPFTPRFTASSSPNPETQTERLTLILNRLEALRQEQDELLGEVRSILTIQSSESSLDHLKIKQ